MIRLKRILTESATYTTKQGSKLEFCKVPGKGKQNQVDVINHTSGKTHRYALYVKGWFGTDALNFKTISAAGNGLRIARWVSGGKTETHNIASSKLRSIDWAIAQGKPITYDDVVDIQFKPV